MGTLKVPQEFWRVVAKSPRVKRERTYNGPSAKRKAKEFAFHAKNSGATEVVIECCIPEWTVVEIFSLQEEDSAIE